MNGSSYQCFGGQQQQQKSIVDYFARMDYEI